jgi:ABC-type antimicrobial peptide transport system permease subunit
LGRTFHDTGKANQTYLVIGVVHDTKYYSLREDALPIVYVSFTQANGPELHSSIVIRSNQDSQQLMSSLKSVAKEISPAIVLNFSMLHTQIQRGLVRERLMATVSGFFGVLATVLAVIGLYGVISYLITKRTSEIGLRMALGANRADILRMVLREAALLLGAGLIVGTILALAAGNVAASLLFGLKPRDPLTLAAAISGMIFVSLAATLLPARRAVTVDPMTALREE